MENEKTVEHNLKDSKLKNIIEDAKIIETDKHAKENDERDILEIIKKVETDNELKYKNMNFVNENLLNLLNNNDKNGRIVFALVSHLNRKKEIEDEISRLQIIKNSILSKLDTLKRDQNSADVDKSKLVNDYASELKEAINEIKDSIENTHKTLVNNNNELKIKIEKTLKPRFSTFNLFNKKDVKEKNDNIKKNVEEWLTNKKEEMKDIIEQTTKIQNEFNSFKEKTSEIKLPKIDDTVYKDLEKEKERKETKILKLKVEINQIEEKININNVEKQKIDSNILKLKNKYHLNERESWIDELKKATKRI